MNRALKVDNVVYVEMPQGVSYHHFVDADGVLLVRRLVLTNKVKDDYDCLSQYLFLLGLLDGDTHVIVFDEDNQSYDIINPDSDRIEYRLVPAVQGKFLGT